MWSQFSSHLFNALQLKVVSDSELSSKFGVNSTLVTWWVEGSAIPNDFLRREVESFVESKYREFEDKNGYNAGPRSLTIP